MYPANTGEVGPRLRDSNGVVWQFREKRSILEFLPRLLSGKYFARMTFFLKGVNTGWDHLMHAIGVGIESPQPLSTEGDKVVSGRETKQELLFGNGEWCGKHPLSRSNGQITTRLVGSPGEMPIRNQKWLVQP